MTACLLGGFSSAKRLKYLNMQNNNNVNTYVTNVNLICCKMSYTYLYVCRLEI